MDAAGEHCAVFSPEDVLKHPVTAFTAGQFKPALSKRSEPCLVYVSAGGEIVLFHGLYKQVSEEARSARRQ